MELLLETTDPFEALFGRARSAARVQDCGAPSPGEHLTVTLARLEDVELVGAELRGELTCLDPGREGLRIPLAVTLNPVNEIPERFAELVYGKHRGTLLGESVAEYAQAMSWALHRDSYTVSLGPDGAVADWHERRQHTPLA